MATCVSGATEALVVIDQLDAVAAASSMAGSRQAFIDIPFTVLSNKPWKAGASVAADAVYTLASVSAAWLGGACTGGAVVFIHFTPESVCSWRADTGKVVDQVDASSSIEAGLGVAFVYIILTVHSLETWFAYTFICALIILACSTISAGV